MAATSYHCTGSGCDILAAITEPWTVDGVRFPRARQRAHQFQALPLDPYLVFTWFFSAIRLPFGFGLRRRNGPPKEGA